MGLKMNKVISLSDYRNKKREFLKEKKVSGDELKGELVSLTDYIKNKKSPFKVAESPVKIEENNIIVFRQKKDWKPYGKAVAQVAGLTFLFLFSFNLFFQKNPKAFLTAKSFFDEPTASRTIASIDTKKAYSEEKSYIKALKKNPRTKSAPKSQSSEYTGF